MKLTETLLRIKKSLPNGHIFRGKNKLIKQVTPLLAANKRAAFELEEKNMFYLRHPYLTPEQEFGHAKLFKHKEKFFEKHKAKKMELYEKDKLLGDRFGFLRLADKWE